MESKELETELKLKSISTLLERKDCLDGLPPCLKKTIANGVIKVEDRSDFLINLGFFLKIKYGEENFDYILNDISNVLFNKKDVGNKIVKKIIKTKHYDCNCKLLVKHCNASICSKIKKYGYLLNKKVLDCSNLIQEIKIENNRYYVRYNDIWLSLPDGSYLINKNLLSKLITNKLNVKCHFIEKVYIERIKKLVEYARQDTKYIQAETKKALYNILKNPSRNRIEQVDWTTKKGYMEDNKKLYYIVTMPYLKFMIEKSTNFKADESKIQTLLYKVGFLRKKSTVYGKDYYYYRVEHKHMKLKELF